MITKKEVYELAKKKGKEVSEEGEKISIEKVCEYEACSIDSSADFGLVFVFDGEKCIDIDISCTEL